MKMENRWDVYSRVIWRFVTSYTTAVVFCYLLMVLLARRVKKLFLPFDLRWILIIHNSVCVLLSIVSMVTLLLGLWEEKSIVKLTYSEGYLRHGLWIYWISKYYELLDTVFMLLRHRFRQMSFLHVFHHASMAFLSDYSYNYAPWPPIAFGMCLNAGVHIVMYSYYILTAFFPLHEFTWKKHITQMQLAQFVLGVVICVYGYFNEGYCVYSFLYPMALIALFSNYYYHAFLFKKEGKKKQ